MCEICRIRICRVRLAVAEGAGCCQVGIKGKLPLTVRCRFLRGCLTIPRLKHAYHTGAQEVAASGKEAPRKPELLCC